MRKPFNYINDEKIDLSNPAHLGVVKQRNEKLKKAVEEGIHLNDLYLSLSFEFECPKCGYILNETTNVAAAFEKITQALPKTIVCDCCNVEFYLRPHKEIYMCVIPEIILK